MIVLGAQGLFSLESKSLVYLIIVLFILKETFLWKRNLWSWKLHFKTSTTFKTLQNCMWESAHLNVLVSVSLLKFMSPKHFNVPFVKHFLSTTDLKLLSALADWYSTYPLKWSSAKMIARHHFGCSQKQKRKWSLKWSFAKMIAPPNSAQLLEKQTFSVKNVQNHWILLNFEQILKTTTFANSSKLWSFRHLRKC